MNKSDKVCMSLGQQVVKMIHDVQKATASTSTGKDVGYTRVKLTYPGGECYLIVANNAKVADAMEAGVEVMFNVISKTPASEVN